MTAPDKNAQLYQENTISSARPEELTLMMYNGLMKFIARAQEEIKAKSLEAAHNTLIRCQDIVFEFQYTLNMDYAVSTNLMLLYDYLYNRLIEANAKKSVDILSEALVFVTELRDTWVEAVRIKKDVKPREEEAAPDQPRPKAIYTKNGRIAGNATHNAQTAASQVSQTAASQVPQTVAPQIPQTVAPQHDSLSSNSPDTAETQSPGYASLPDAFEQAAAAARALNNPMNRINPSAAAKYAKISKSKSMPHEIISLTSK